MPTGWPTRVNPWQTMSDTQQTADSSVSREDTRTKPNVVTSESIAAMYSSGAPTVEAESTDSAEVKAQAKTEAKEEKQHDGKKNSFQERIQELVSKRKEAESEAQAAKRENQQLMERLKVLEATSAPSEVTAKPTRSVYASDDDYIEALTEWKADQAIAKKESAQAEARQKAAQEEVNTSWAKRQKAAMREIDDYAEVIGKSDVALPGHIHQAILESEIGPHLAYYFAANPDEAKRFTGMTPTTALRNLGKLEDQLADASAPTSKAPVEVSKAPKPIAPVKDLSSAVPGSAKSFEEYRAQRQAERKR